MCILNAYRFNQMRLYVAKRKCCKYFTQNNIINVVSYLWVIKFVSTTTVSTFSFPKQLTLPHTSSGVVNWSYHRHWRPVTVSTAILSYNSFSCVLYHYIEGLLCLVSRVHYFLCMQRVLFTNVFIYYE